MISCIVPVHNEEKYIGATLQSLIKSKKECVEEVEIIVVNNHSEDDTRKVVAGFNGVRCVYYPVMGRELAKNFGAECAKGEILCFIDADCLVSENFFSEISDKAKNPYFVGGGMKYVKVSRYSIGILTSLIPIAIILLFNGITVGALWVRKEVFISINGFRTTTWDDICFAIKLKQYAKENGKKFESLKKSYLIWNTRKFDKLGDFYWIFKAKQGRNATG